MDIGDEWTADDTWLPADIKDEFRDVERERDRAVQRGDTATARAKTERMNEIARELGKRF